MERKPCLVSQEIPNTSSVWLACPFRGSFFPLRHSAQEGRRPTLTPARCLLLKRLGSQICSGQHPSVWSWPAEHPEEAYQLGWMCVLCLVPSSRAGIFKMWPTDCLSQTHPVSSKTKMSKQESWNVYSCSINIHITQISANLCQSSFTASSPSKHKGPHASFNNYRPTSAYCTDHIRDY